MFEINCKHFIAVVKVAIAATNTFFFVLVCLFHTGHDSIYIDGVKAPGPSVTLAAYLSSKDRKPVQVVCLLR